MKTSKLTSVLAGLFLLVGFSAVAQETNMNTTLVPQPWSELPIVKSEHVKGGMQTIGVVAIAAGATQADINSAVNAVVTVARRTNGMVVSLNDGTNDRQFQLIGANWVEVYVSQAFNPGVAYAAGTMVNHDNGWYVAIPGGAPSRAAFLATDWFAIGDKDGNAILNNSRVTTLKFGAAGTPVNAVTTTKENIVADGATVVDADNLVTSKAVYDYVQQVTDGATIEAGSNDGEILIWKDDLDGVGPGIVGGWVVASDIRIMDDGSIAIATNKFTVDALGNVAAAGTLGVTGNTTVGGTLGVTGNSTMAGTLGVTGNTTVGGTLGVTGVTTVGSLTTAGALNADGAVNLGAAGVATTVEGTLAVTQATTLSSTLGVTGNTTVGGTLGVTGNSTMAGTLGVTGVTTVGSLTTAGALNADGAVNLGAAGVATTVEGTLAVTQAATLSSTLGVTGIATFSEVNGVQIGAAGQNIKRISTDVDLVEAPLIDGNTVLSTQLAVKTYVDNQMLTLKPGTGTFVQIGTCATTTPVWADITFGAATADFVNANLSKDTYNVIAFPAIWGERSFFIDGSRVLDGLKKLLITEAGVDYQVWVFAFQIPSGYVPNVVLSIKTN